MAIITIVKGREGVVTETHFKYNVTGHRLTVDGIHFGSVEYATAPIRAHHIYQYDNSADRYPNPLLEVFERGQDRLSGCTKVYSDLTMSFTATVTAGKYSKSGAMVPLRQKAVEIDTQNISRWHKHVVGAKYLTILNRCFFVAQQGYMGIGPPNLWEGDICSVLSGARVPFIFRHNSEDSYQLVGESYVESIMDGQVLGMLEHGEVQRSSITLV